MSRCIYEVFEEQKLHEKKKRESKTARDAAIYKYDEAEKTVKGMESDGKVHTSQELTTLKGASDVLEKARQEKMSAIQKIDGETTMKLTFALPEEEAEGLRIQLAKPNGKGFQEVKPLCILWQQTCKLVVAGGRLPLSNRCFGGKMRES